MPDKNIIFRSRYDQVSYGVKKQFDFTYNRQLINDYAFEEYKNLESIRIGKNVEKIGKSAFRNCEKLTNVTIPENIKIVGDAAFEGCSNLVDATLCDGVQEIGNSAFKGCSSLETLYLGNTIKSIGSFAFSECGKIWEIHNASKAAISAEENIFSEETYLNACLKVPTDRIYAYQNVSPWNKFYLQEFDYTGIEEINEGLKNENGEVNGVYYDLNGRMVDSPTKGIYIVNGKKVLVK